MFLVQTLLHLFAGTKERRPLFLDEDCCSIARVSTRTRRSVSDRKYSKTPQFDTIAVRQGLADVIKDATDDLSDNMVIETRVAERDDVNEFRSDRPVLISGLTPSGSGAAEGLSIASSSRRRHRTVTCVARQ